MERFNINFKESFYRWFRFKSPNYREILQVLLCCFCAYRDVIFFFFFRKREYTYQNFDNSFIDTPSEMCADVVTCWFNDYSQMYSLKLCRRMAYITWQCITPLKKHFCWLQFDTKFIVAAIIAENKLPKLTVRTSYSFKLVGKELFTHVLKLCSYSLFSKLQVHCFVSLSVACFQWLLKI